MGKQSGMTLVGMVLTVAIIVVLGVGIMRVVPVYIEYYAVTKSINSLQAIPANEFTQDPLTNANVLRTKLNNQLYVNGVEIPKEKILIKPIGDGQFKVAITYQVKKPLFGNMSLLFDFDEAREVTIAQ